MELKTNIVHTYLRHKVRAFDFSPEDFIDLQNRFPGLALVHHDTAESLEASLDSVEILLCWDFIKDWYQKAGALRLISTPAAGDDWIARDASASVTNHFGTFHGPMLSESLLGAMLYLNRRIPALLENQRQRRWDRDLQAQVPLLRGQTVLLIGYGHIAAHCAQLLSVLGCQVLGYRRSRQSGVDGYGVTHVPTSGLPDALGASDHVVLLLPGGASTDRLMNPARLAAMKKGSYLYNFGRGNALLAKDLIPAMDSGVVAGAVLDVVEEEPLPGNSPLWTDERVLVMPHSSCVYREYKSLYLQEVAGILAPHLAR